MIEIKTGQELWDIIQHPNLEHLESEIDKEAMYELELFGGTNKYGVLNARFYPVKTPEQIAEQEKQSRIEELEKLIDKGNKVGDDVSAYKDELKSLYGETHDEYIDSIKQEALDNQILELMEGGLL